MSKKLRTQVNINLSPGQMEQLRILADHYGSVSAAVRVALDALWREFVHNRQLASIEDNPIHEDGDARGASV